MSCKSKKSKEGCSNSDEQIKEDLLYKIISHECLFARIRLISLK
ncbi:hypothetical protein FRA_50c14790 [Francisella sp. W12-1067]|nr:hypothetical protein FRA_50c14790 [Francisella sp. W12-1067]